MYIPQVFSTAKTLVDETPRPLIHQAALSSGGDLIRHHFTVLDELCLLCIMTRVFADIMVEHVLSGVVFFFFFCIIMLCMSMVPSIVPSFSLSTILRFCVGLAVGVGG